MKPKKSITYSENYEKKEILTLLKCRKNYLVWTNSLRVASCNNWVSTSSAGNWTYLTTEPRIKLDLTEDIWGCFSGSVTLMSVNLMFKYWSTLCRVPQMDKSFFQFIYNVFAHQGFEKRIEKHSNPTRKSLRNFDFLSSNFFKIFWFFSATFSR